MRWHSCQEIAMDTLTNLSGLRSQEHSQVHSNGTQVARFGVFHVDIPLHLSLL